MGSSIVEIDRCCIVSVNDQKLVSGRGVFDLKTRPYHIPLRPSIVEDNGSHCFDTSSSRTTISPSWNQLSYISTLQCCTFFFIICLQLYTPIQLFHFNNHYRPRSVHNSDVLHVYVYTFYIGWYCYKFCNSSVILNNSTFLKKKTFKTCLL